MLVETRTFHTFVNVDVAVSSGPAGFADALVAAVGWKRLAAGTPATRVADARVFVLASQTCITSKHQLAA